MTDIYEPEWSGPRKPGRGGPKKGTFWIVPFVGLGCVLIIFLALNLRDPIPGTTLPVPPPEALGQWATTDKDYADRGLRIGHQEIVLEVGPDQPPVRARITVVTSWQEDQFKVVHIEYDAGEGNMVIEMLLQGDGTMRLRNPRNVTWTLVP